MNMNIEAGRYKQIHHLLLQRGLASYKRRRLGYGHQERVRIRIRNRNIIVHKEASLDLWDQSIHVFSICVSFLRRGIHRSSTKSLCVNKAYTYELNLLGGVLSMTLKLSLPLILSAYLEWIALYAEHVKSKWHSSSTLICLHCILYAPSNSLHFDTMMQLQYLTFEIECELV